MKRITLFILIFLPGYLFAQDFKNLIAAGDSLNKLSKRKQALNYYDKAIKSVITYRQTVNDIEWFAVLNSAANLSGENKKYDPGKYAFGAEVFLATIKTLKKHGVKCIFTFNSYSPESGHTSYIHIPSVHFYRSNDRRLLVWSADSNIYMKAFGDNIYKQKKLTDKILYNYLVSHCNDFKTQAVGKQKTKTTADTKYYFTFYCTDGNFDKTIADPRDLYYPPTTDTSNYIAKILPSIRQIATAYFDERRH